VRARFLFVAAVLLAFLVPALRAQDATGRLEIPRNQGWVTDLAGMLTPTERHELEALMESYKQGSTHEIALLTVESLKGEPIEKFALEVGRSWGIGGKEKNNGAILVVSKNDRKIRIETGRGLEGSLPDSMCGRIIREVIAPRFKQGRFGEGLTEGVRAIHAAIGGEYGRSRSSGGNVAVAVGLLGLVPLVFIALFILFLILRMRGRGGRRGGGGMFLGPWLGGGGFGGFGGGGGRGGGGFSGGGFSGFGGGGGFSGGGASGGW
jgi:uncharacterized protein